MIQAANENYGPKLEATKPFPLSLAGYRVDKPWGYEIWMDINEYYAYKLIHMNQGCMSSLQSHEMKVEANYVIDGEAEVLLENEEGIMESFVFTQGTGWTVPVGKKHRVIARTDYTAIEVSSPHLDDVIRYNDDFGRGNGKVDGEHGN